MRWFETEQGELAPAGREGIARRVGDHRGKAHGAMPRPGHINACSRQPFRGGIAHPAETALQENVL